VRRAFRCGGDSRIRPGDRIEASETAAQSVRTPLLGSTTALRHTSAAPAWWEEHASAGRRMGARSAAIGDLGTAVRVELRRSYIRLDGRGARRHRGVVVDAITSTAAGVTAPSSGAASGPRLRIAEPSEGRSFPSQILTRPSPHNAEAGEAEAAKRGCAVKLDLGAQRPRADGTRNLRTDGKCVPATVPRSQGAVRLGSAVSSVPPASGTVLPGTALPAREGTDRARAHTSRLNDTRGDDLDFSASNIPIGKSNVPIMVFQAFARNAASV
jgi:hypothetical protein